MQAVLPHFASETYMKHCPLFVLHALPVGRPPRHARCKTFMHAAPGLSAGDQVFHADWRSFRARLVRDEHVNENINDAVDISLENAPKDQEDEWAHQIAQIEVGCILVSIRNTGGRPVSRISTALSSLSPPSPTAQSPACFSPAARTTLSATRPRSSDVLELSTFAALVAPRSSYDSIGQGWFLSFRD